MFKLFKRKDKFNSTLYDLELKIEAQNKLIAELRTMILEISRQVNALENEVNYLSNNRYGGKSI
jgi:uncharacterized coiled-coil protein SlyX